MYWTIFLIFVKTALYCATFFFILGGSLSAQTNLEQTLQRAEKHISDAEHYYAEMNYEQAKESYQFAARLYRNNNLAAYYARCYNGIGNIYIDLSLYEDAKNKGFDLSLQQLAEMQRIDSTFVVDSLLVADAYEGLGRYYSSIATIQTTDEGQETTIQYTKALQYHQRALTIRKQYYDSTHPKIALSYYYMGQCYRGFSNLNSSDLSPVEKELELLEKALQIQRQVFPKPNYQTANTYQALGNFYYELQKDYHKGFAYHQKALQIRQQCFEPNHLQIASSYTALAIYYRVMNLLDQELTYLEKALQIQLKTLGTKHVETATNYYLLANRYRRNGELEQALNYCAYALHTFVQLKKEQSLEVAAVRIEQARCYRALQQRQLEWIQLKKSQKIYERVLGRQHLQLSTLYLEQGRYYLARQQYDSTLFFFKKALTIQEQQLGAYHPRVATTYDQLATVYQLERNREEEYACLRRSLHIRKKGQGATTNNRALNTLEKTLLEYDFRVLYQDKLNIDAQYSSFMNLANFYKRSQEIDTALWYVQKALRAIGPSLQTQAMNIYSNPSSDELVQNVIWLQALHEKGSLLQTRFEQKRDLKDLKFALETYKQAVNLIDRLRMNANSKSARQELNKRSAPIFEAGIATFYTLFQESKQIQYLQQAFQFAERSKSFNLLQALRHSQARGSSNIPNQLLEKEERLRRELAYYSNYKNRAPQNNQRFNQAYFKAKRSYDSLITHLEQDYATYYNLKYQNKITSLNEALEQLPAGKSLLLEYYIGDRHWYVFKLSKEKQEFFQLPITQESEALVTSLRLALTNYEVILERPEQAYKRFTTASHQYYQEFVEPFIKDELQSLTALTVIPDGFLHYIPFEVLLHTAAEEQPTMGNYKDLDFLLKVCPINYHYSATLMVKNAVLEHKNNNGLCLGFAPNIISQSATDSLPWTQYELQAIERMLHGEYYYGQAASKAQFKEKVQDFSIIHLATHGLVNIEEPMQSRLSFAMDERLEAAERALFAYEIHNLTLQADLVVLSACETGYGKTIRGEGVLSLAQAFLYAGAPSVITTLWEVNDFTSAALVEAFYVNLSNGMPKPKALQEAKLTFLSKTDQISGHPCYWGSFISIGNPDPVKRGYPWWVWVLMGLGCCLIVGHYGYRHWRR